MKCYIATYYKYDNYGSRLQNFALCEALNEFGVNSETLYINDIEKSKKVELLQFIKKICCILPILTAKQKKWINEQKKKATFIDFNLRLNIKSIDYKDLDSISFDNAIAIAGSDQIWSPKHLESNEKDIKLFFLQFVPEDKRYAYAPSFGVEEIPTNQQELYKENLRKFRKISIREDAGKYIIKSLIDENVLVVPDPVFLLSKEQWKSKLEFKKKMNEKKYILAYFLGESDSEVQRKIDEYSKNNCLKIINVAGNFYDKGDCMPSPNEFVELIEGANIIFTDSFHACAFSIIMNKPFFVFRRNDVNQFSRIETLLDKFKYSDCKIDIDSFDKIDGILEKHTFNNNENLICEKQIGLKFLHDVLNQKE